MVGGLPDMAALRRALSAVLLVATLAVVLVSCARGRPPGPAGSAILPLPDLRQPAGPATRARMHILADNPQACRIVLEEAGIRHQMLPGRPVDARGCGYAAAVRRQPAHGIAWLPDAPATGCAVAAALHLWERDVVQPAARRHLGQPVTGIRHLGSFACRGIGGGGQLSEHGRANAIDIAGFRLASGRELSLVRDWQGDAAARAFLREVRDGACRLFGTVLSPDHDAAHADHFHFDQARRAGGFGSFCR